MAQLDADATALERLRHVAAVRDDELHDADTPSAAHVHPAQREAANDPTGCANDDHDADPHAHRDRSAAPPSRGQEYERVVISRLGPPGNA